MSQGDRPHGSFFGTGPGGQTPWLIFLEQGRGDRAHGSFFWSRAGGTDRLAHFLAWAEGLFLWSFKFDAVCKWKVVIG
ncbi:hypothetical protein B9K06_09990 [Bacillus sp. OG2]|nr:hypothetical protein B9K06_09990 [Bacillus sp. OG2]